MSIDHNDNPFHVALQYDGLGFDQHAMHFYQQAIDSGVDTEQAIYHRRLLQRRIARRALPADMPWSLVFLGPHSQIDVDTMQHPKSWQSRLLGRSRFQFVDLRQASTIPPRILCVVGGERNDTEDMFLRVAFESGVSLVSICSDEWYRGYAHRFELVAKYSDLVISNYHTALLDNYGKMFPLPLGWMTPDYVVAGSRWQQKTAAERKHLWSFAGNTAKSSRTAMLENMGKIEGGHVHHVSGWMIGALGTAEYRALMDDTVFAPCPTGWSNLETYRTWEALEAGCIPIVERRPTVDYFRNLCGDHPMLTVSDWSEVGGLIDAFKSPRDIERKRRECSEWWEDYKDQLAADLDFRLSTL